MLVGKVQPSVLARYLPYPPTCLPTHLGRPEYLPPRYMSIRQAITQLLEIDARRGKGVCPPDARAVGCALLTD